MHGYLLHASMALYTRPSSVIGLLLVLPFLQQPGRATSNAGRTYGAAIGEFDGTRSEGANQSPDGSHWL